VIHRLTRRYAELVEAIIHTGIASGEFRGMDEKMVTFAILGACNWIHRWYSPEGRLQPGEISAAFTDFFLRGLGAVPAAEG
jgi:hypothetical protein